MEGSVFNRSIWEGFSRAFRALGLEVTEVDDTDVPDPAALPSLPDLLFAVHGGTVPTETIALYRELSIRTAVYLLDEPYEVERSTSWARAYDWVFTVDRMTVSIHAARSESAFLPLAYDDTCFRQEGKSYASDVLVLGSPFEHRLQLLAPLRRKWGRCITWVGRGWRPFCPDGKHVDQFVTPEICARFYRGAEIVINIHRDSFWSHWGETNRGGIVATHLNPRFWEASACGSFQLCSYRADIETFAPRAVSFETSEQLAEQLDGWWEDEAGRLRIAEDTKRRVMPHTYGVRAQTVISLLEGGSVPEAALLKLSL